MPPESFLGIALFGRKCDGFTPRSGGPVLGIELRWPKQVCGELELGKPRTNNLLKFGIKTKRWLLTMDLLITLDDIACLWICSSLWMTLRVAGLVCLELDRLLWSWLQWVIEQYHLDGVSFHLEQYHLDGVSFDLKSSWQPHKQIERIQLCCLKNTGCHASPPPMGLWFRCIWGSSKIWSYQFFRGEPLLQLFRWSMVIFCWNLFDLFLLVIGHLQMVSYRQQLLPHLASIRNDDANSTTDSDGETSSESSAHDDAGTDRRVDLTYERIQSMHGDTNTVLKENMSEYAKHGSSKERVVQALRRPCCNCKCRVPATLLMKVVMAFWLLNKTTQDSLLWSLQHEAGVNKKKKWFISGSRLNQTMLSKMMLLNVVEVHQIVI